MRHALVTGAAGFIGAATTARLLEAGWRVTGLDAMTDYYEVSLKEARLAPLRAHERFTFVQDYVETPERLMSMFAADRYDLVVHLAAQAGVRYSLENPRAYLDSNVVGAFELLEAARAYPPEHLMLASTSSIYGANTQMPYCETDRADHQMSFYAATKKAGEAMAHAYAHLHGLPITMFRFFTVYGPWGRPDMALFKFTRAILEDRAIDVYNHGKMRRDFTYIDDLVEGIVTLADAVPGTAPVMVPQTQSIAGDSLSPVAPFRVVNVGNAHPVELGEFIAAIETAVGRPAKRNLMEMQPGDVPATWADTGLLHALTGTVPQTSVQDGVARFVAWYRDYYAV